MIKGQHFQICVRNRSRCGAEAEASQQRLYNNMQNHSARFRDYAKEDISVLLSYTLPELSPSSAVDVLFVSLLTSSSETEGTGFNIYSAPYRAALH